MEVQVGDSMRWHERMRRHSYCSVPLTAEAGAFTLICADAGLIILSS